MKKTYDPLNSGFAELYKDIEKIKNELLWVNQVAVQSLEPMLLSKIHTYGNMNTNLENFRAVVANNKFTYRRNKYRPTMTVVNTDKQATFAEYGYGIVGSGSPLDISSHIDAFGDVGWEGYDVDTPAKMEDRGWRHKDKITWGEPSIPTYYKTYMYFKQNIAQIIGKRIDDMLKKL